MTDLKEDIRKILHPNLHPPTAPKPRVIEKEAEATINGLGSSSIGKSVMNPTSDSKIALDFNSMPSAYWKWCNALDTKRCWELAHLGKTHRGSTARLKRDVQNKRQELDMIKLMKQQKAPLYRECMSELKEVLKKRNERR